MTNSVYGRIRVCSGLSWNLLEHSTLYHACFLIKCLREICKGNGRLGIRAMHKRTDMDFLIRKNTDDINY